MQKIYQNKVLALKWTNILLGCVCILICLIIQGELNELWAGSDDPTPAQEGSDTCSSVHGLAGHDHQRPATCPANQRKPGFGPNLLLITLTKTTFF